MSAVTRRFPASVDPARSAIAAPTATPEPERPAAPAPRSGAARRRTGTALAGSVVTSLVMVAGVLAPTAEAAPRAPQPGPFAPLGTPIVTSPSAATLAAEARMSRALSSRVASKYIGSAYGALVEDAATGRTVFARHATTPVLPASNMKIVTAVTSLTAMGPTARFTTKVVQGASSTDIVLVGGGDPLLTTTNLGTLARATAAVLRSTLPSATPTPAPTTPSTPATPPVVTPPTDPATPPVPDPAVTTPVADPAVTTPIGSPAQLLAAAPKATPPTVRVRVDDSLFGPATSATGWTRGYLPYVVAPVRSLSRLGDYSWDGAARAATAFVAKLRYYGITAVYAGRAKASPSAPELARYDAHTLAQAIYAMLQPSENNIAEVLFRHVGLAVLGKGTWAGARAASMQILKGLNAPTAGVFLADGSGVSRADRVTPLLLTSLLRLAADPTQTNLRPIYYGGGLPLAGKTGTLRSRLGRFSTAPSKCAAGKVRAKTGTLHDVVSLSGITVGKDGLLKVFSFVVNKRNERYAKLSSRRALDNLAATVNGCW